jgi:Protein of unknown function (DUF3574)
MSRLHIRSIAVALAASLAMACAVQGGPSIHGIQRSLPDHNTLTPRRVQRPDIQLERGVDTPQSTKGHLYVLRRLILQGVAPVTMAFSALLSAPVQAVQQIEAQAKDRPIVRRRAPEGQRHNALAFVRTELFFGTAKPSGVVTEEEFNTFLDDVITPLFPDGLTVIKADGQFKGADGLTIKEDSFVVVLLYPVDGQKASSRNIDSIRSEYMRLHQQESVLRVDDPFLVWVSF